ncbi:T9SS type A sorting domain-containing protein, partial [candidate division WOR-3 bacterium]|nr:T9SS type A sorting domain-containing protein [candidate division WOR-3 bacterium]MBD3364698.1 T9SS type A sorting domain-containing protein [candidate division WOR-3 bacterium]
LTIPAFGWVQEPTEATGYYYMYDDEEEGPPFAEPELSPLPTYEPIWDNPHALILDFSWYGGRPYQLELDDSFWFYNQWYEPGDHFYISEDGWLSFDESSVDGYPKPPTTLPFPNSDDPNEIIAPLWEDNDPTIGMLHPDNVGYYLHDPNSCIVTIEWHNMYHFETNNTYDFMLTLQFGGQELFEIDGDEVLSRHLIHFLYNTSSAGWDADEGATGIEDHTGEYGITYGGEIVDERVIRFGYKGPYSSIRENDYTPLRPSLTVMPTYTGYNVRFSVVKPERIKLEVFDASGRFVRTLAQGSYSTGYHTLTWDGLDAEGWSVPQGIYLIRMEAGGWKDVKKVVFLN